jgi:hypothetical protein
MIEHISKRPTKPWLIGIVGVGAFLIILSVIVQLELPRPTGPYPVGRVTRRWVDMTRPETQTTMPDDFREVPVEIWYPAGAGTGSPAPYFPDLAQVADALSSSGEVEPLEAYGLRFIRSHERLNASLAPQIPSYPVILLSPGNGTNVEFYAAIANELASFGYIVIGLNHPYDVAAVRLNDGSVAQFVEGPLEPQARPGWVKERIAVRTADVLFVLEQLQKLNESGDRLLSGHLDLMRMGVMGHSLGGITAAEACRAAPQLRACLNLDGLQQGGPFSVDLNPSPPDQPFMMITKEQTLHPAILALFAKVRSGSYRVVLPEAAHDSFTDGPLLLPAILPLPNKADQLLAFIRAYTLAFFEQTIDQRPSKLLSKPLQSQSVVLEVYPNSKCVAPC